MCGAPSPTVAPKIAKAMPIAAGGKKVTTSNIVAETRAALKIDKITPPHLRKTLSVERLSNTPKRRRALHGRPDAFPSPNVDHHGRNK